LQFSAATAFAVQPGSQAVVHARVAQLALQTVVQQLGSCAQTQATVSGVLQPGPACAEQQSADEPTAHTAATPGGCASPARCMTTASDIEQRPARSAGSGSRPGARASAITSHASSWASDICALSESSSRRITASNASTSPSESRSPHVGAARVAAARDTRNSSRNAYPVGRMPGAYPVPRGRVEISATLRCETARRRPTRVMTQAPRFDLA
jgi:hypothetical protein